VPANADKILELVFSGGTALAGLILVFLGASLASFDTYTPTEKGEVRSKYRRRGYTSLAGFGAALLTAIIFACRLRSLRSRLPSQRKE
jgi:hypothetical protein